jgi:hypothetical protein
MIAPGAIADTWFPLLSVIDFPPASPRHHTKSRGLAKPMSAGLAIRPLSGRSFEQAAATKG